MSEAPATPTTEQRVLALFERHRARPGAPYEASRFLDFLLADPRKPRAVHDSFRGKWRFHAFLDAVQLEFGVCFNNQDRDSDPPLERFVERIEALRASRRSSLASLRYQRTLEFGWPPVLVLNLFGLMATALANLAWRPLAVLPALALVVFDAFVARAWFRARAYLRVLAARLDADR